MKLHSLVLVWYANSHYTYNYRYSRFDMAYTFVYILIKLISYTYDTWINSYSKSRQYSLNQHSIWIYHTGSHWDGGSFRDGYSIEHCGLRDIWENTGLCLMTSQKILAPYLKNDELVSNFNTSIQITYIHTMQLDYNMKHCLWLYIVADYYRHYIYSIVS